MSSMGNYATSEIEEDLGIEVHWQETDDDEWEDTDDEDVGDDANF